MRHLPLMRRLQELGKPDQIVGRQRHGEGGVDPGAASQFDLGETGRRLDPAEHLLDPLAAALADGIARMTQGAPVDGRLARLAGLAQMPVDGDVRVTERLFRASTKASTS